MAVNCNGATDFTVYPNPGTGIFTIQDAGEGSIIRVTDVLGQVVFQTRMTGEKTDIDLHKLLNGVYFVQVVSKGSLVSKSVIVGK